MAAGVIRFRHHRRRNHRLFQSPIGDGVRRTVPTDGQGRAAEAYCRRYARHHRPHYRSHERRQHLAVSPVYTTAHMTELHFMTSL